jgi:predicted transposase/invertase (TIGR01784 family)
MKKEVDVTLDNYSSLNDFLFYKYMCEDGNQKQQKTFLKSLGVPVKGDLNILNETLVPMVFNDKKCILDFFAETDDTLINIELQQEKTVDFNERMVYYMSKITRLKKGKIYTEVKKLVLISITNFKMNELPYYKHKYRVINTKNLTDIFTDKLEIRIIELKKFRKIKKDFNNKEHLYLTFIDDETTHEERKEMGKMDEGLEAAVKKIEEALQDDNAVRLYHKLELEKMKKENEQIRTEERIKKERKEGLKEGIEKGREEGKEEGIEKGMKIANINMAIKLKKSGGSIQEIAKLTGFTTEFVEKL